MGCCHSSFLKEEYSPEKGQQRNHHNHYYPHKPPPPQAGADLASSDGVPSFSEFSFSDLKAATNNFSEDFIVSESGEKGPNLVYKGRLQNRRWVAVKKFPKTAWPDPKQFAVCMPPFFLVSTSDWIFLKIAY